ncbi:Ribosomal RNA large subunit methyltransferase E (23S rRNA Um2552 methyltransferase) (rRNA (uridine-2'-O-)-methyltransferase), partial [Durusdinium trenchii]
DKVLIEPLENHHFVQGDIQHAATIRKVEELLGGRQANLVLADLAPRMSGSRMDDHLASIDLARSALHWALSFLRHNGTFVTKVFDGASLENFKVQLAQHFAKVRPAKPKACRKESVELYLVCQGFASE